MMVMIGLLSSCKGNKQDERPVSDVVYTEAQARAISYVTSGDIHFDDEIKVVFNDAVVSKEALSRDVLRDANPDGVASLKTSPFTFKPDIDGKAYWKERNVLIFKPDKHLPGRTHYEATLKIQEVSTRFKEEKIEDLVFRFHVLGRDLTALKGNLELKDRDDPKILQYSGTLAFSEKTTLEAVQKAVTLKGDKKVSLNLSQVDDWNFRFTSSDIVRTDKDKTFTLHIDKKKLELENDVTESFVVTPVTKMAASTFNTDEAGRKPRIRIDFSDEVDMEQHLDGLITVSPNLALEIKKLGKTIILDGPFKFGSHYQVTVHKGIRSRWGGKTEDDVTHKLNFQNIQPQVEFASDGIILPTSNKKKLQFYTTNLKRVHLEVKKVFPGKLGPFLQTEQLSSSRTRNKPFSENYESNVGVIVKNQTIELGAKTNEWLLNEFDLSGLFSKYNDGLFLVRLTFTPEDVHTPIESDVLDYLAEKGQVYKPVFLSDLGMTVKDANNTTYVFVTDILTGQPKSGVKVTLLDYEGTALTTNETNGQGVATFGSRRYFSYVLAQQGLQITALSRDEMQWSHSGFDIGGVSENFNKTKGFVYTERGVYRPGDSIHVGFIVKNADQRFPANHPATIQVHDPEYNTVYKHTSVKAKDGFYVFAFKTDETAPTGTYSLTINTGGSWFYHNLKIETVVADQLKVAVKPGKKQLQATENELTFGVNAAYLFGAPAGNLKADVTVEVHPFEITFPKYTNYTFTRADLDFKPSTQNVLKQTLDAEGNLKGSWRLPPMGNVPSALKLKIIANVFDKGGQPNGSWNVVTKHVYPYYVGLRDATGYGYYKTGDIARFPLVLLDNSGKPVAGRQLTYRIYRNDKQWWYQFESRQHYRLKYKEDNQTYLVTQGVVQTTNGIVYASFTPSENGEYLIEVSDGGKGHTASLFFSAYQYGSAGGGQENEGTLTLKATKATYTPDEKARITLPNPKQGMVLVTLEKGNELLRWFWVDPKGKDSKELLLDIPLTKAMIPTVYVTVSVLQPHDQTINDRPLRLFGIIPLNVEDPDSKLTYSIASSASLAPNKPFTLTIQEQNRRKSQLTVAVVDEGLLSLTQFKTPQPWQAFNQKVGLFVNSFDVFSHVMSANKSDVLQTFSIGGADGMDYRESQLDPVNGQKRFDPVCLFKGPFTTDNQGKATVTFTMPNYNGAVRVMVIGTDEGRFGSAEKSIPVRSDLIIQPSLPSVLHPGDVFTLPVSLYAYNKAVKTATLTLAATGPLEIIGPPTKTVTFGSNQEADVHYQVRVKAAIGQASITLKGQSGTIQVHSKTAIQVVPSEPRVYDKLTQPIEKGKTLSLKVPKIGLTGTNRATLEVNLFPNMDFDHRLKWLIDYPYGCLEQITSTLFPQLGLKKMGYFTETENREIDVNLNEGIALYQQYLLSSGLFSYWPGENEASEWASTYATHFLIEARKAGYAVPDHVYNRAVNGQRNAANRHSGKNPVRVYRTLVLALANTASLSEMNMLMENKLNELSNAERWMLATAYHLAGAEKASQTILSKTDTKTQVNESFDYTFGSIYRDDALILYCATLMKQSDIAGFMAKQVAAKLSSKDYLSTQSTGFMLLALVNYFNTQGITAANGQVLSGTITLANGKQVEFNHQGRFTLNLYDVGQTIQVKLKDGSQVDKAYVTLSWDGVPLKDERDAYQKNLQLTVAWYDEHGKTVDPQTTRQGSTLYGRFSVKNAGPASEVNEVALVQLLPSGWAIDNLRLNNTLLPDWVRTWNINKETYQDIRDDRVMWFFNLKGSETLDCVVKLTCVHAGDFWLPATLTEAMYNSDYSAKTSGRSVHVEAFN